MPRRCSACEHKSREQIDAALLAGGSLRDIARQYGLGKDALANHKHHMVQQAAGASTAGETISGAPDKPEALRRVLAKAEHFMEECATRRDFRGALLGAKTVHEMLRQNPDQVMNDEPPRLVIVTTVRRPDGTFEEQEQVSEFPRKQATPLEKIDWSKAEKA